MAKKTEVIRTLAAKDWPEKGQTGDLGIGSRVRGLLSEYIKDGKLDTRVEMTYKAAVSAIKGADEKLQRVALLAAASDYSLGALTEKAVAGRRAAFITVDDAAWERVKSQAGWDKMPPQEIIAAFNAAKVEVKAERSAKRGKK